MFGSVWTNVICPKTADKNMERQSRIIRAPYTSETTQFVYCWRRKLNFQTSLKRVRWFHVFRVLRNDLSRLLYFFLSPSVCPEVKKPSELLLCYFSCWFCCCYICCSCCRCYFSCCCCCYICCCCCCYCCCCCCCDSLIFSAFSLVIYP